MFVSAAITCELFERHNFAVTRFDLPAVSGFAKGKIEFGRSVRWHE
jgi:hypothetical protein